MDNNNDISKDDQLTKSEYYLRSAEEHKNRIRSVWITFLKTGVFVVAACLVLLFLCLAWFVSNSEVNGSSMSVSSMQNMVRIASKGARQTAEINSKLGLPDGTPLNYNNEDYYYTEDGEIAMRLSEDYSVSPGACGSIEFYIIPKTDGKRTVTLYLELDGYCNDADGTAVQVNDEVLTALLKGHILLFENYENGFYSGWMYDESSDGLFHNIITVTLPDNAKAEVPYGFQIYWIWPKRYENMIAHREERNDLFSSESDEFENNFMPFIEKQASSAGKPIAGTTNYYYSSVFIAKKEGTTWQLNDKNERTKAYNLADEYIGTNADYLYLTIRTSPQPEDQSGSGGTASGN